MIRKFISAVLSSSIILSGPLIRTEPAPQTSSPMGCSETCESLQDTLLLEDTSETGHRLYRYESGVEVEVLSENEWIIRYYPNVFEAETPEKGMRSWTSIGLAILTFANAVLTTCQTVQYITGHDICRIVLSYLTAAPSNGTFTYELTGTYIPGYIPGCEPAHSLPCNSGYWEYRVIRK